MTEGPCPAGTFPPPKLEPGQVLPITLSRFVALRVGDQTIGQGTLGKRDDQMAIQLKQFLKD